MDTGSTVALVLFAIGVIYSAGKVSRSVDHLGDEIKDLKEQFAEHNEVVAATLADHGKRIGWIEGRLQ